MSKRKLSVGALAVVPLLLCGCGLVAVAIAIPLNILSRFLSIGIGIRIGAEGARSIEEELNASGLRIDRHEVEVTVGEDGTFEATIETERTLTAAAGLPHAQTSSMTFDPASQQVDLLFAQVIRPDGTSVACDPREVIEGPSSAAESTPGYVSTRTRTVLFSQLSVGSRTLAKWRIVERGRSPLGFQYAWRPPFALDVTRVSIRVRYPTALGLQHAERGGFRVTARHDGGTTTLHAALENYLGQRPERAMVAPRDVCPIFVVSGSKSREAIGAEFFRAFAGKTECTPEIREAAARIVGGRVGLEAARAIHRFVARDVHYLAVYLDEGASWIPRSAREVLATGYGDCKDQTALLIALLSARGIAASPVLVDRQLSFEPLPHPTPLEFDHCVAYLPEFDLYSDPTDPQRDLGELEVALSDKLVVIATAEGRVARTPAGNPAMNRVMAKHRATLDPDGTIRGTTRLEFHGRPAARFRERLAATGSANRVADELLFATLEGGFGALDCVREEEPGTPLECEGRFASEVAVDLSSDAIVPVPAGIDPLGVGRLRPFASEGERRYPLVAAACSYEWELVLELPTGFRIDRLPPARAVTNAAGSFVVRYEGLGEDRLIATRALVVTKDRFSPSESADFQQILRTMLADSHAAIGVNSK